MNNPDEILDLDSFEKNSHVDDQYIISTQNYIILYVVTGGLYGAWWMYKAWRFYKQKENLDILPAARTVFALFFTVSLFDKILSSAKEKGYREAYSSVFLFLGSFFFGLFGVLPAPYFLISFNALYFYIPPFKALNYYKKQLDDIAVIEQTTFNTRQWILMIIFMLFWGLVGISYLVTAS